MHADDAYANLVLPPLLTQRRITGRDAAFATELLAGTCRLTGTYDQILVAASGRALGTLQPAVLDLLRLGCHQLLSMRVPTHAAVAATVDLAAATVGERVTGLVNAVLRKVAARSYEEWTDDLASGLDDVDALALRSAHPRWIVAAYAELLPAEEVETALLANNDSAPVSLVVRPGLATVDELLDAGAEPGRWSPYAASWSGNPAELAAVRHGTAGVQDEGSQLTAWGLGRIASTAERGWWLDLCAGPGGKAALLAGLAAERSARLVAVELAPHRARLVAQGVRGYPEPPTVVVADGTRPAWPSRVFDRVLADVPCSGLGALRRRAESRWRRTAADVEELHPPPGGAADVRAGRRRTGRRGGVRDLLTAPPGDGRRGHRGAGRPRRHRPGPRRFGAARAARRRLRRSVPAALAAPARHRRDVRGLSDDARTETFSPTSDLWQACWPCASSRSD